MTIRLVLFDAFSTLLVPRLPVYVQYSQTFEPYLGTLEPEKLKESFKIGAVARISVRKREADISHGFCGGRDRDGCMKL